MNKITLCSLLILLSINITAQDYGDLPKLDSNKLQRDLELLYQGLDKFHSGMYWYTPKDSVDIAFQNAKTKIATDLNILQFNKIIAPLVALSREDHTDIQLPKEILNEINTNQNIKLFPFTVVFLGTKLFLVVNASNNSEVIENLEVTKINGETPEEIVSKSGSLFASDGYIKNVKYSDLEGFNFSKYYYFYYGIVDQFKIELKENSTVITIKSLSVKDIKSNIDKRANKSISKTKSDLLQFKIIDSSTAYIDIQSFSDSNIKEESQYKSFKKFLESSFKNIRQKKIKNLIIDISKNGGGTEGNEGLLYSYIGSNYQKYLKVKAKTQKAILDNGIDKPIKLKTFGILENLLENKKIKDGSLERRESIGLGLMAFKKEPKNKFLGKVYVLISPITYSGASEFANMIYSQNLATFIGQETGGGYLGNTSGYTRKLILPNSKIIITIPALQFVMNVEPKFPIGSGVKPKYEVIPTIKQYLNNENVSLNFALKLINN